MTTLIIIDAQYDFAHPDGSLYVPNGNAAVEKIIDFINVNHNSIGTVVFTMDNHPLNHCSFKANGGEWPNHCVQGTHGAEVLPELIEACKSNKLNYKFLKKGEKTDVWEYTAFSRSRRICGGFVTILRSETNAVIVNSEDFIVCGFAGDYCVKDSIRDLGREVGMDCIKVFRDGVADIDDGTIFNNFIAENSLSIIDVNGNIKQAEMTETIYMVANIKAYKGRVIPLTVHISSEKTEWLCDNTDENYSVLLDANSFYHQKHERETGFGKGRYRYFSDEKNAKKYMLEHAWN